MKRNRIISFVLLCVLLWPASASLGQGKAEKVGPHGNADYIKAEQLKDYLAFVASDEMEGRDTPSRGLDITAKFLASHLSRWGLKPAGDNGTYFQRIALTQNKIDPVASFIEVNGQRFNFGEDFLSSLTAGSVSGALVYVGHGWFIKAKNIDAYQGLDVKDKIVVVNSGGLPKGVRFNELTGKQGEDWDFPLNAARKRGAKGIIFIPNFQTLANWDRSRLNGVERGFASVDKFQQQDGAAFPSITASPKLLTALLQGEKQSAAEIFNRAAANESVESFEFKPEKKATLTIALKKTPATTQNVVAVLEGSDPALKNEYV
ncbi:MAG TPA: hypothetical protein PLQ88_30150, partial [Blastocatellia bacterium]|nr:hypothetical protein [Blastocatellia bacterium]